mgnify:FL=1
MNKSRLPVTRNHQGASCAVSEVQFGRRRWSITIQAKLAPGGPLLESWQAQNWIVNNRLTLSSEKETLTPSSRKANVSARSASFVYHFEPPPKLSLSDLKLSYEMPLKLIEVPIRFQFKNLKLP